MVSGKAMGKHKEARKALGTSLALNPFDGSSSNEEPIGAVKLNQM
jgi:hypothetical protein